MCIGAQMFLAGNCRAPFNLSQPSLWIEEIDLMWWKGRKYSSVEKKPKCLLPFILGFAGKQQLRFCQNYLWFRLQALQLKGHSEILWIIKRLIVMSWDLTALIIFLTTWLLQFEQCFTASCWIRSECLAMKEMVIFPGVVVVQTQTGPERIKNAAPYVRRVCQIKSGL